MKQTIRAAILVAVAFSLNFGIFIYSYRILAFPYLHESQRMENAPLIFSYVLAGFLISAAITSAFAHLLHKRT